MKYLIIGAGGTGASIGAAMTRAKKDVTLIARGAHLKAIQSEGLHIKTTTKTDYTVFPVNAMEADDYNEHADVIFVCVKSYSLEEVVPFIKKASHDQTIVIPILNVYGTGIKLQKQLPKLLVCDGCIYIAAEIAEPGVILQNGDIFRIIFGVREPNDFRLQLTAIANDLKESRIDAILSDRIQHDTLLKFSFVSPMAACGQYYDINVGPAQKPGEIRETLIALMREIGLLAQSMGIPFKVDFMTMNLNILDGLGPNASASMQRDIRQGKKSEIDGLIFEVVRLGKKFNADIPTYERIANKLGMES